MKLGGTAPMWKLLQRRGGRLGALLRDIDPPFEVGEDLNTLARRSRSGRIQKQFGVRHEQFRVLKESAMPGVGIHDQLRLGDVLRQSEGIDRRDHYVVVAVNDQGGLLNRRQVSIARSLRLTPLHNRSKLRLHSLNG